MSGGSSISSQKKRKKACVESSGSDSPSPERKTTYYSGMSPPGKLASYDQLYDQLMTGFRGLMNEQTASFSEGLQRVENAVAGLVSDNKLLSEKCAQLSKDNLELREYVERLDSRQRRNNLVLSGFTIDPNKNLKDEMRKLLRDVLGMEDGAFSLLSVNTMGAGAQPPIMLEFGSSGDVQAVLRETGKLQGTQLYISRDLTPAQRLNRNKSLKLRYEIKKICPNVTPKVIRDGLLIEGKALRWVGDRLVGDKEDGLVVLNGITGRDFSETVKNIVEFKPMIKRNSPR
ncbi:hypothetical protein GE061_013541 [Apolygus lucorum]|uniref:Uncharacterized protein n=1 Tax=Apolygus lucorum TaxID=248454 RepID=A0A6A4KC47_APOLU|nr:hypothetical protein GE061_013541 [Apolygus lucorum]